MRLKLTATAALIVIASLVETPPAGADREREPEPPPEQQDDGDVVIVVGTDGGMSAHRNDGNSGGGERLYECTLWDRIPSVGSSANTDPVVRPGEAREGGYYLLTCYTTASEFITQRVIVWREGVTVITPESLGIEARELLEIGVPEPRTSPRTSVDQIVGIDTWMWLEESSWQPESETAAVPGLSVTATATPSKVTWDMGDGTVVTCDGPGTAYDFDRPDDEQSTDCSHLYQEAGTYAASATVTWTVSWSASGGGGGALADVERTTDFTMNVVERQAVGRR